MAAREIIMRKIVQIKRIVETAPEFTQAQLTKFKKYPDPENKFYVKIMHFYLNLRLHEYATLFEN